MKNSKVDEYISKKENWRKELELLRAVFSDLPVVETIKWGAPTYVFNNNVFWYEYNYELCCNPC